MPWRWSRPSEAEPLDCEEIVQAAAAVVGRPGAFLIGGGDPLARADLWNVLDELARLRPAGLGVCTSGRGLSAALVQRLRAAGVERTRIPFHSARQDAHDWLVGQAGALKTAHRAIRACLDEGMPVAAEITLTRPTAPHLAETVRVLARVGVRTIYVRRLSGWEAQSAAFVPLSPRLSLLEESLEQAAAVALERRIGLRLVDLPLCAAPRLRPLFAGADGECWVMPDGSVRTAAEAVMGCATCPGPPLCAGAPRDYESRFGWEEFNDPRTALRRLKENPAGQKAPPYSSPMVFSWRGPRRVRCDACGDPADDKAKAAQAHQPSREIRALLVQAAGYRPSALRLVGADLLAHPQAALLIYDALRLFPHVEVAGEASPIASWSDLDLRRVKDLRRVDVALYGPDAATHDAHCGIPGAFAAALRAVQRLRREAKVAVGAYAILHDARSVPAFADAWGRGALPGEPRFRLSARGGSLDELLQCARQLPEGKARAALSAVLPHCLCRQEGLSVEGGARNENAVASATLQQRISCGRSAPYRACGSDPLGSFETCADGGESCSASGCPGTAAGWRSTARSKQWTVNI